MKQDNGFGKLSKKWSFFICVFGTKKKGIAQPELPTKSSQ